MDKSTADIRHGLRVAAKELRTLPLMSAVRICTKPGALSIRLASGSMSSGADFLRSTAAGKSAPGK